MSSCPPSTHTAGPIPVWTAKSTTNWLFHPMTAPLNSTTISAIRASIELDQSTGVEMRPALRMTNDGSAFDQPVAIGTMTRNTNGTSYGNDFVDVSSTTKAKQLCQLGVEVRNVSGSAVELAMASAKFDVQGG